eukprot:g34351.t1
MPPHRACAEARSSKVESSEAARLETRSSEARSSDGKKREEEEEKIKEVKKEYEWTERMSSAKSILICCIPDGALIRKAPRRQ